MMKYERLTKKKLRDTDISIVLDEHNNVILDRRLFEKFIKQHNRLAELEDKIEQGTLIELPCKVGDTVYYVLDYGSVKGECVCVEKGKVRAIEMRENYIWIEVLYDDFISKHPSTNIGETVFLTREDAEKKLKELQNG